MQRSLGGNWLINFNAGLGFAKDFDSNNGKIFPAVGLKFTYVLF